MACGLYSPCFIGKRRCIKNQAFSLDTGFDSIIWERRT